MKSNYCIVGIMGSDGRVSVTPEGDLLNNLSFLRKNSIGLLITEEYLQTSSLYLHPILHDGKIGFINRQAEIIIQVEYSSFCGDFENTSSIITVQKDNSCGAINSRGEIVIPFQYRELYPPSANLMMARDSNYHYGYITLQNKVVIPFGRYEWVDTYFVSYKSSDIGYARVKQNGKWGIINSQGKVVVPIEYDTIWTLREEFWDRLRAILDGQMVQLNLSKL